MTLFEIAQQAQPGQMFRRNDSPSRIAFDSEWYLEMPWEFRDSPLLSKADLLADDWEFIEEVRD